MSQACRASFAVFLDDPSGLPQGYAHHLGCLAACDLSSIY